MLQHRPVHAFGAAAAHFVPVVASEFQLCPNRQAHLGDGRQVVEPRLTGDLLRQKPAHLLHRCLLRQPREQRVTLARSHALKLLEPSDEAVRVTRRLRRPVRHLGPLRLQPVALLLRQGCMRHDVLAPALLRQTRREPGRVERGQPAMPEVFLA